jgi:hypothetical protein
MEQEKKQNRGSKKIYLLMVINRMMSNGSQGVHIGERVKKQVIVKRSVYWIGEGVFEKE